MSVQETAASHVTRTLQNTEVPIAGTWNIDASHTSVEFVARHFMLSKVRGRFTGVSGSVVIADDPADSSVDVTIDMSSVNSGHDERDGHLRSGDFFDVDRHPTATFRSTTVDWAGSEATVTGDLTIAGVTRQVDLDVEFLGATADPWGNTRSAFSASTEIDRDDWGLTWNMALEAGGVVVSKRIRIEIESEIVLVP